MAKTRLKAKTKSTQTVAVAPALAHAVNAFTDINLRDIWRNVIPAYLDTQDLLALMKTCRRARDLFTPAFNVRSDAIFVKQAVSRQLDKVAVMLQANPRFFLSRSSVTDDSLREFESVSGLEYFLWAGDKSGSKVMLDNIPTNEKGLQVVEALQMQLTTMQTIGVSYHYDGKNQQEIHYDASLEMQVISSYSAAHDTATYQEKKAQWVGELGPLQRLEPLCVAHAICRGADNVNTVALTVKHDNSKTKAWYPLNKSDLGETFAIARGNDRGVSVLAPSEKMATDTLAVISKAQSDRVENPQRVEKKLARLHKKLSKPAESASLFGSHRSKHKAQVSNNHHQAERKL